METARTDLLPINHSIFGCPDVLSATPWMFDNFDIPAQGGFDPFRETHLVVATICPDQLEARETALQRREQEFAAVIVLKTGLMHQHMQDQPARIDQQMPLATLNFLAAVITANPPFWLVLTD